MKNSIRTAAVFSAIVLFHASPAHSEEQPAKDSATPQPKEIQIVEAGVMAENLTSTQDGTVFFGSNSGTIYRALPGAAQAEPWIQASAAGLTNVFGVLADEKSNTLWACANPARARGEAPSGETALRTFDLKTGEGHRTYPFPGGGVCNDVAIAADGAVYTTDTMAGRILKLAKGAEALEVWIADPQLRGADGLSLLADGSLYVNNFFSGALLRIVPQPDGKPGEIEKIETSLPFTRPDGLRTSGPKSLLQAEGQGRVTEITIEGNKGQVRVIKEGLSGPTGVTQVEGTAFVLTERRKAVPVPMSLAPAAKAAE